MSEEVVPLLRNSCWDFRGCLGRGRSPVALALHSSSLSSHPSVFSMKNPLFLILIRCSRCCLDAPAPAPGPFSIPPSRIPHLARPCAFPRLWNAPESPRASETDGGSQLSSWLAPGMPILINPTGKRSSGAAWEMMEQRKKGIYPERWVGRRLGLGGMGRAGGSWIPPDSFLRRGNLRNRRGTGKESGFDGITPGISVFPTFMCQAKGFSLGRWDFPSLRGLRSHFMGWEKPALPWKSPEWSLCRRRELLPQRIPGAAGNSLRERAAGISSSGGSEWGLQPWKT